MTTQRLTNSATCGEAAAGLPPDVVVQASGVSKKFCKRLRRSMAYGIADLARGLLGLKLPCDRLRRDEFWAVDDVSFELRRGEVMGLIGVNGSGKTTLLRLLAGIYPPDRGEIAIKGRVGALISLGAGFHPHMTGRENIYLNGTILGMTRRELDAKVDDIIAFAQIADFVDAPVATYSAGMKVRLGFSIAINVDPDVLLVDEVLAVGDAYFRHKCMQRLRQLMAGGTAIIFVSHQVDLVRSVCTTGLLLEGGKVLYRGGSETAVDTYLKLIRERRVEEAQQTLRSALERFGGGAEDPGAFRPAGFPPPHAFQYGPGDVAEIINVEVLDEHDELRDSFWIGDEVNLRIYAHVRAPVEHLGASFLVRDGAGVDLVGTTSHHYGSTIAQAPAGRILAFTFAFRNALRRGHYSISVALNRLESAGDPASSVLIHQFDNVAGYHSSGLSDLDVYHRVYVPVEVEIAQAALPGAANGRPEPDTGASRP